MVKSREQWEAERDLAILRGQNRAAEWIDRKILYPIGNLINGKYPGDEKFKCRCGSHVAVMLPSIIEGCEPLKQCVVCFDAMVNRLAKADGTATMSTEELLKLDAYAQQLGKATYTSDGVGVNIFDE